jgi:hypothetical protein
MADTPFDNVRGQLGRCGIWCGSCVAGNGALALLSRRYADTVEKYGLPHWGPKEIDYDKLGDWLGLLSDLPPCRGCLAGDGDPSCKLRPCALENRLADCTACENFASCPHDEALQKVREGARDAGMRVKSPGDGPEVLDRWTAELKRSWPSGVLFMED